MWPFLLHCWRFCNLTLSFFSLQGLALFWCCFLCVPLCLQIDLAPDKVRQTLTWALTVCLIKLEYCQRGVEIMLLRPLSVPLCHLNEARHLPLLSHSCNYWGCSQGTSHFHSTAYEYLSSLPGLPDARLTGGCSCHFIISSRNHLGLGEAAEETQYARSIGLVFTQDSILRM